jgi:hypothetical protein
MLIILNKQHKVLSNNPLKKEKVVTFFCRYAANNQTDNDMQR